MKALMFALGLCGVAAACVPEAAPPPGPVKDTCGSAWMQYLVGSPATILDTILYDGEMRIIRPDTAVTMDFRADRINISIDAAEKITRVYCG